MDHIAAKFGIGEVYGGCKDKAAAVRDFAERHDFVLAEVCFIGDDVNDVPALEICGLAVTPAGYIDPDDSASSTVHIASGGQGAVRAS